MSVALMRPVADMHAVRPQCRKLITSARTESRQMSHAEHQHDTVRHKESHEPDVLRHGRLVSSASPVHCACELLFRHSRKHGWMAREDQSGSSFSSTVLSTHHKHDLEIGLETKILQKHLFVMPMRVAVDIGEKTLTAASTDLFDESAFLLNDEILQPLRVGCGDRCTVNTILWTIQDPSGRCKRLCTSVLAPALAAENFRSATRASGAQSWSI